MKHNKNIDKETGKVELGTEKDFNFQFPIYSLFFTSKDQEKLQIVKDLKTYVNSLKSLSAKETKKHVKKLPREVNHRWEGGKWIHDLDYNDMYRVMKCLNENSYEAFTYFLIYLMNAYFHIGERGDLLVLNSFAKSRPQCNLVLIPETKSHILRFIAEFMPIVLPEVTVIKNAFVKGDPKNIQILNNTKNSLLPLLNKLKAEWKAEYDQNKTWSAKDKAKQLLRHFSGLYNLNLDSNVLKTLHEKYNPENPICILDDICATGTTFRNCYDTLLLAGVDPNAVFGLGIFKTE